MSWFGSQVVSIKLEPHNNAENLSVVHLTSPIKTTVVVRTEDWINKDKAVYILPDSVVPDRPEFEFLGKNRRITARKLRGIFSMGLLVPAQPDWEVGRDVTKELGITKYEDSLENDSVQSNLQATAGPRGAVVYTDIESLRKYPDVFKVGDQVVVSEKIHGASGRACFQNNTLYIGSRTRWLKENKNNWWNGAFACELPEILPSYPDKIFFYEVFGGSVQDMSYGMNKGEVQFRFFDICDIGRGFYLDFDEMNEVLEKTGLAPAPILYKGRWPGYQQVAKLAEEPSAIHPNGRMVRAGKMIASRPENFMEGIVIKNRKETYDDQIGRKIAKYHSERFMTRKQK